MTGSAPEGLARALQNDLDDLVARWAEYYDRSMVRLPGSFDRDLVRRTAVLLGRALSEALPGELSPGSPQLRELEKAVGFAASNWASDRGSGFDLVALLWAGRDALMESANGGERPLVARLFEWLVALAAEAFGDAGVRAEKERQREALERGMPVTLVAPEVPAAFLVGDPDTYTLDGVFGRLMMLVVRVGARSAIIDASGLARGASEVTAVSLDRFVTHRKVAGSVTLLAVGLEVEAEQRWREVTSAAGCAFEIHPGFDRALARALEWTEHRLVKRPIG